MKKLLLVLSLFVFSCEKDNLPEFNRLESLRVLNLQANTPEVNPGAAVTITPIVSDIHATSLNFSVTACLDPGLSYGAQPTCEGNPSKVVIANSTALTLPGVGESWTGAADTFVVNVPNDTVMFAGRSAAEIFNGVNYLVIYTLTNNSGQSVTAFKRIVVSETAKTAKNTNPVTTQVFADGAPLNAMNWGARFNLSTDLSMASAENYVVKNAKLESFAKVEDLTTTWFITDGEAKYFRSAGTDSNEFNAPGQAPVGRSFYLIAVSRDDRGGVSFVKKKF